LHRQCYDSQHLSRGRYPRTDELSSLLASETNQERARITIRALSFGLLFSTRLQPLRVLNSKIVRSPCPGPPSKPNVMSSFLLYTVASLYYLSVPPCPTAHQPRAFGVRKRGGVPCGANQTTAN
jgi:hypothetical protein